MTIYCVDSYYDRNDIKRYYVAPYSLKGTLLTYFGFDFRSFSWNIGYYPWYNRFKLFLKWINRSHISKDAAQRAADRLNDVKGCFGGEADDTAMRQDV